ncbi:uncharacterized protein Tco025E_06775 [Trypanosoma conorhini]|uniref:Potassium channel tetramerisation-type BTB domain-containing protein n=1 Tax=Trypanosoma conorhini TaxID=83891 RepID=A0A3S5ISC2_9TRYP|nr:uncharacterized protein Tco025E_06775 [Trypanosoma conorhini]RNF10596.1 hypothetical protein Tco025E_06775 [Trypanosoma conorhini]
MSGDNDAADTTGPRLDGMMAFDAEGASRVAGLPKEEFFATLVRYMHESLEARLTEEERDVRRRLSEVEQQRRRVRQLLADVSLAGELLSLNVGGRGFTVPRRTLCAVPDSMLALLTSEWLKIERDGSGAIFVDRSPDLFGEVLSYLRLRADLQRSFKEPPEAHDEKINEVDEAAVMAQLTRTNWRHMSSRELHALASEANYYNLKILELYLGLYAQQRWIECGTFVVSQEDVAYDAHGGESYSTGRSFAGDAVLCLAYDEESGVCAAGRKSGAMTVYNLPSLVRLVTQRRHANCVTAVSVTPKHIFSVGHDGCVAVGHSRQGFFALICKLRAHEGFVHDLLLLPERLTLVSCGEDGLLNVWKLNYGYQTVLEKSIATLCPVRCLAAYHHHVFASSREQILVLDLNKGELLSRRGKFHSAPIRSLATDEHRGILASGGWDGMIYIWGAKEAVSSQATELQGAAEEYFIPLYAVAQCDSWVAHVSFVGSLLAASCGSVINFFACGPVSRVVRCMRTDRGTKAAGGRRNEFVRVFLAAERVNCLLIGGLDGALTSLQNRMFAEPPRQGDEKSCQCGGDEELAPPP